jgi:DNA-binding SARP family transcriptional activator
MWAVLLVTALAAPLALAQRHQVGAHNPDAPEGRLLQQIQDEQDEAKKLPLLEQFAAQYSKDEGIAWVYEQLVAAYAKAGQSDKVLETGQKLIALDPGHVPAAQDCLKAAEAKKDPALVLKWSATTSEMARKVVASPQPTDEDAVEGWKRDVDYSRQVDIYTEYALYSALLQTTDPKMRIQLAEALQARNPQSQYIPQMAQPLFLAYAQAGQNEKALAFAEACLSANRASEEMLLALAQSYMDKKQPDQAIATSQQAIQAADTKQKPEGVDPAAWETWKTQIKGRAEWMSGVSYAAQNKWALADKSLRAALPSMQADKPMLAQALFFLGLANYRLAAGGQTERARDALRFSEQCAAIPGPFQASARTNVKAIRSEYHVGAKE